MVFFLLRCAERDVGATGLQRAQRLLLGSGTRAPIKAELGGARRHTGNFKLGERSVEDAKSNGDLILFLK